MGGAHAPSDPSWRRVTLPGTPNADSAIRKRMRTLQHKPRMTPIIRVAIVTLTVCWGQAALSKSATSTATTPQNVPAVAPVKSADYIGEARCIECHGQENKHFSETVHAKAFRQNPKDDRQRQGCEACHG